MSLLTDRHQVYCFPGYPRVPERSLLDLSLIATAQHSDNESLRCRFDITDLPVHLKQYLLSYIAAYRSRGIAIGELQTLLQQDRKSNDPNSCPTKLRHLDLSGSIGSSVTFDQMSGFLAAPVSIDFTSLTHLCLARPGPAVSWRSLLSFAPGVPCLTHLSLAYWSASCVHGLEKTAPRDLVASSLSHLSKILTKLQYLDVEGCTDWVSALGMDGVVDWTGGWKNVHSLNLSQGPMPLEVQFEGGLETSEWIVGEVLVRQVEETINRVRNAHNLDVPPVSVQHGWNPTNCLIKTVIETAWEKEPEGFLSVWINSSPLPIGLDQSALDLAV